MRLENINHYDKAEIADFFIIFVKYRVVLNFHKVTADL